MWETARKAGHVAGMQAPTGGFEDQEPMSWHGEEGWHCVVEVTYDNTYVYREDGGYEEQFEAPNIEAAKDIAENILRNGEWGDKGAKVTARVTELDEDGEETDETESVTVEIPPNDEALIREAARYEDVCGYNPEDHEWTREGESGLDENPGVWSRGGTTIVVKSHCRRCGLHQTEVLVGSQSNPDEHDTVEYRMLDDEEIKWHIEKVENSDRGHEHHTPSAQPATVAQLGERPTSLVGKTLLND